MEKYGEVPPRFTKKWWEYFWYYYKWHVIITAAAVIIAAVTITQCINRPRYDMTMVYAGHMNYSDNQREKMQEVMSPYVSDVDGNGKSAVFFQPLMFSDGAGNEDYDYAIQTKLDLTFVDDYTFIYLMDEIEAKLYMQRDKVDDMFENTNLYAEGTDAEIIRAENGNGYAVSLKNSKLLKDNGIYCDDVYVLVRKNTEKDEKNKQSHDDALKIAAELIK